MAWDVMSGVTKTAWDVMSGVTNTAWDVLSGVANLYGMFCPGWQKMAWDVLSRDVLSGSPSNTLLKGYPLEAKTAPKNRNQGAHISRARPASPRHPGPTKLQSRNRLCV